MANRTLPASLTRPQSFRVLLAFFGGSLFLILNVACQSGTIVEVPRLATQTAQAGETATAPATPLFSAAPTATGESLLLDDTVTSVTDDAGAVITLWVNETSAEHGQALEEMITAYETTTGIGVELLQVSPDLLPEMVQTAVFSGTLPDIILHPAEYSIGWAQRGILDALAATQSLDQIGRETFDPAALKMLATEPGGGMIAALPSDGWQQLLIYRRDWFEELDLAVPDDYDALLTAAEALHQPESIISGFIVPTDSALISTQQVFEHIASANGCNLVDSKGEVMLLHPACLEGLEFYRALINQFSPIGLQTDISALNAYLAGRTGMIMASPAVLPDIAGFNDAFKPNCPQCVTADFLSKNSGFVSAIDGRGEFAAPANFGQVTSLGITTNANKDAALAFAEVWFNEGYESWLGVNPERKIPMRWGTADLPRKYIDEWAQFPLTSGSPSLVSIYGQPIIDLLIGGIADSNRWGFNERQGGLVTKLYEDLVLSPLLQEMLSGYFTSSQTIIEMYKAVIGLIPDYGYTIDFQATPTP